MSLTALMNQTVTLRSPSGETRDGIGGSEPTYSTQSTLMYLEPTRGGTAGASAFSSGREINMERNTPIGDWLGIGDATLDWTSWSQVVYGSHVFDIIAPPRYMPNPRLGTISHVELSLQEVT